MERPNVYIPRGMVMMANGIFDFEQKFHSEKNHLYCNYSTFPPVKELKRILKLLL